MVGLAKYFGIKDAFVEIWGHILSYVDDEFTLWVTCGQVSHVIRTEAEREFSLTRLPKLSFSWSADCSFLNSEHTHCYRCKVVTESLQCFLQDRQEVKYKIKIDSCLCDGDDNGRSTAGNYSRNHSSLTEEVIGLLGYRFLTDKMPQFDCHCHRVELGYYVNDTPLKYTNLDFDNLILEQSLDQLFEGIAANSESKIEMLEDWKSDYGKEEDQCFFGAYVDRVRHTHPKSVVKTVFLLRPAQEETMILLWVIEVCFRILWFFLMRRLDPNIPDTRFMDETFKRRYIYPPMPHSITMKNRISFESVGQMNCEDTGDSGYGNTPRRWGTHISGRVKMATDSASW
ncbi:hypothetical protein J3E71DRAFT_358492 [Bipolaris maydis]|nr:hypothetical protein J3E71DRAFT_358492 [Bipolaris maydis]